MAIQISCECGQIVIADERDIGRPIKCEHCGCWHMVPDPSLPPPAADQTRAALPRPAPGAPFGVGSIITAVVLILVGALWALLGLLSLLAWATGILASTIANQSALGAGVAYVLLGVALIGGTIGALRDKPSARLVLLAYIIGDGFLLFLDCVGFFSMRRPQVSGTEVGIYLLMVLLRGVIITMAMVVREQLTQRLTPAELER